MKIPLKYQLIFVVGLFEVLPIFGQNRTPNSRLSRDTILAYPQPCSSFQTRGTDCVWDFSNAQTSNAQEWAVTTQYLSDSSHQIQVHRPHQHTYYTLQNDTLYMQGYETSHSSLRWNKNKKMFAFPLQYGDSCTNTIEGNGEYCHT